MCSGHTASGPCSGQRQECDVVPLVVPAAAGPHLGAVSIPPLSWLLCPVPPASLLQGWPSAWPGFGSTSGPMPFLPLLGDPAQSNGPPCPTSKMGLSCLGSSSHSTLKDPPWPASPSGCHSTPSLTLRHPDLSMPPPPLLAVCPCHRHSPPGTWFPFAQDTALSPSSKSPPELPGAPPGFPGLSLSVTA